MDVANHYAFLSTTFVADTLFSEKCEKIIRRVINAIDTKDAANVAISSPPLETGLVKKSPSVVAIIFIIQKANVICGSLLTFI